MNPKGLPFLWVLSHCNAKRYPAIIHTNSFLCPKMGLFNCPSPNICGWHMGPSTGSWAKILESSHAPRHAGSSWTRAGTGDFCIARWTVQYRATREGHVVCACNHHRRTPICPQHHGEMKLQTILALQTKRRKFQIKSWEWLRNSGFTHLRD